MIRSTTLRLMFPLLLATACTDPRAEAQASATAPAGIVPDTGQHLPLVPLSIATKTTTLRFRVEVAATPEQQEMGLMFRSKLAPDRGMIFPFSDPRVATFWMKNTPQPLDLVFIRDDGTIARIAAMATPYALDVIPSGEPVASVLEIAGGRAAAAGIAEGDRVVWAKTRGS